MVGEVELSLENHVFNKKIPTMPVETNDGAPGSDSEQAAIKVIEDAIEDLPSFAGYIEPRL